MKNYSAYFVLPAPPEEVYEALTNPLAIRIWSDADVVMQRIPDTEFSLFDGSICGKNLAFEENRKIIQEWYFGEQEPASIVTLLLHPKGTQSTSVELRHTHIPDKAFEDMKEGWQDIYFGNLLAFFEDETTD